MWTTSTNGRLTFRFVPNIRRNRIAHTNFSKKLTAVLTGHGKFNMCRQFYGHILSAYCVCKKAFDDVEHYLFHCPLYSVEREDFLAAVNSLTSSPLNLSDLLNNPLIFCHLNLFIISNDKLNYQQS